MNGFKQRRFSGRTSGANIFNKYVFVCNGCGVHHVREPSKKAKPAACIDCGRMDFTFFHSVAEANRFAQLELERKAGLITDLKLQVPFVIHAPVWHDEMTSGLFVAGRPGKIEIGKYLADFTYTRDGKSIVEDVKGNAMTDLAAWKLKHVEAEYGVTVNIIRR